MDSQDTERPLTVGETAVGLQFNPSQDPTIPDELDRMLKIMGEKIVKGIYISVATDNDYDTQPLENWLKHELTKLISKREIEANTKEIESAIAFIEMIGDETDQVVIKPYFLGRLTRLKEKK